VTELTVPAGLRQLIDPSGQVAEQWRDAPISA
jgi:hypothetical protein